MILLVALIVLCLVTLWMSVYAYRQAKVDIFRPVVIAIVTFMVYYVFDVLYAVWDSTSRSGFGLSGRVFVYDQDSLTLATFLVATFTSGWVFGDILAGNIASRRSALRAPRRPRVDSRSALLTGAVALAFVVGAFILLFLHIQDLGGLGFYWSNIGNRALFFADASILYAFIQLAIMFGALSAAFMVLPITRRANGGLSVVAILFGVTLLGLVFTIGLLSGARASIVKTVFVLAFMRHVFVANYRPTARLALAIVVIAGVSVVYGYQTRTPSEDPGNNVLDSVFNTVEVSQGNNLLIIANEQLDGFARGRTLLAGSLSFVPGAALDTWGIEKGEGGNALFTSLVWPNRWAVSRSEVALGILGELYLNFGLAAVPLLAVCLGAIYKMVYERLAVAGSSLFSVVLNVSVSWSVFQLLRGDLFNTVINFAIFAAACACFYASVSLSRGVSAVASRSRRRIDAQTAARPCRR